MSDIGSSSLPDKLRPLKSPVLSSTSTCQSRRPSRSPNDSQDDIDDGVGPGGDDDDLPEFERHSEPTLLEIFFDLFFAANYNVFSDTQNISDKTQFEAFVGYFCILWLTWFAVTLFDVRFVTDSIFSRVTRAIQLGVLVGFAVVAPSFNPKEQHPETMQILSLILACSRACLTIEYGTTLWHVRRFKAARLPLCLQIAVHFASASVYLGVSFRYTKGISSRAYLAWYCISGAEAILCILLSNFSPVLSFTRTHLMKRLTLLTVMIIGEGVVQVAQDVVTIVKNPDAWDAITVGQITSAAATFYIVFLVYFDWLKSSFHLPALRQQAWTVVHLPFHLALVIFTQGFTQLILWSTVLSRSGEYEDFEDWGFLTSPLNKTTSQVYDSLNASTLNFFNDYPPKLHTTWETIGEALKNISRIPDWVWAHAHEDRREVEINFNTSFKDTLDENTNRAIWSIVTISCAKINAFVATYGIKLEDKGLTKYWGGNKTSPEYQLGVMNAASDRYILVFAYTYIATGATLLLMIILTLLVRGLPRKAWPKIRIVVIVLLALGTGLTALFASNRDLESAPPLTPWLLPMITLMWCVVLIVTHVNGEGVKRNAHVFNRLKRPHAVRSFTLSSVALWDRRDREDRKKRSERSMRWFSQPDDL
ncbi:hypothetical protein HRG_002063 [Hirsutella rhossiliensis]|uniref:Bacterial low temperature requirement A protein (LtrA) domain-containing protein n=1 Tax=Hirsutella rhossiliensis TaxID=111463 RepID=A0A9P8N4H1_9HYPO|nr:bacterial low temperature requirement A protein (LtrA) domain-containing protein [Hirsutella rhossiliensis]KAH0966654.1 bacterial low temperature requirement A protein (LtrA) domain-containing protein [Hirsutella rhossiliensis]